MTNSILNAEDVPVEDFLDNSPVREPMKQYHLTDTHPFGNFKARANKESEPEIEHISYTEVTSSTGIFF